MSALQRTPPRPMLVENAPDDAAPVTGARQAKALAKVAVARHLRNLRAQSGNDSFGSAVAQFELAHANGQLPTHVNHALSILRPRTTDCPDRATLYRWDADYTQFLAGDARAVVTRHQGRTRETFGWEARAMHFYAMPSKPSFSAVAEWLIQEGHDTATYARVRRYLRSLPVNLTDNASTRIGPKAYRDETKSFKRRDTSEIPAGFIYQGDGHTIDAYLAHPATGKLWRAELTAWIDVRSRYIVGWYISESESAQTTLFALSHALLRFDHVPAMLHIDNGSGFKSKMMNDMSRGFYARFGIEPMFSIPGNPKGKGHIERWFRTYREQFDKRWETYCGDDMAPDVLRKIVAEINTGKRQAPSLAMYVSALTEWVERYNHTPHDALDGATPAEGWATLERTPLHTPREAIVRPRERRVVRRSSVQLHNREYDSPELIQFNGSEMLIEYDLHNDNVVRVLDVKERWVCDAWLVRKADYLPASRVDEAQQRRLEGQRKRLARKLTEVEARAIRSIGHDEKTAELERMNAAAELIEPEESEWDDFAEYVAKDLSTGVTAPVPEEGEIDDLDVLKTDY